MLDANLHNANQLWLQRVTARGPAAMRALGAAAAAEARRHCPVDTGALSESIRFEVTADRAATHRSVGMTLTAGDARAPYAAYVEYGDAPGSAPQPFVRPSLNWVRDHGAGVLARAMRGRGG